MATVSVRYIVDDVSAASAFYTQHLGFGIERQPAAGFVILARGDLRLLLSASAGAGGTAQPMPDGRKPEPGGWNRIRLEVDDLASTVETLRNAGGALPQRHCHWLRRQADTARRPRQQPDRTVRTATPMRLSDHALPD